MRHLCKAVTDLIIIYATENGKETTNAGECLTGQNS